MLVSLDAFGGGGDETGRTTLQMQEKEWKRCEF
jgi:hypothetical protein